MTRSIHLDEAIATRMPEDQAGVRVVRRHHLLVRCSRWRPHLLRDFSERLVQIAIEPVLNGVHRRNGLLSTGVAPQSLLTDGWGLTRPSMGVYRYYS